MFVHSYHRNTPTLSTCVVAKKSPVGEKVKLVVTFSTANTSIICPDGRSHVRIVASSEEDTIQRPSGLKVCYNIDKHKFNESILSKMLTHTMSVMRFLCPQNSRTILRVSMSITLMHISSLTMANNSFSTRNRRIVIGDSMFIV
jgi:hypothetical protein